MKQIHYAPMIGGVVSYDTSTGQYTSDITIEQFLEYRREGRIKHIRTERGHSIFHGQVDIYKENLSE